MEIRQLKYFVTTAQTLNFSEAAKALFITQSTLSHQIRQLENEFDAQLFQRNSHTVCLTEIGEELLPYALETLHAAETCINRIHDVQQLLTGNLHIGVTYSFSPILTETLVTFMKRYPHVKLNVSYKPMQELMEMLQRRQLDFVLAFKPTALYEGIESHMLFDNHLAAIVRDQHPLAQMEKVGLQDLEHYDMALPAKGLQARNKFDLVQAKYFNQVKVRVELNEVNILLKLIKQTNLVSILSEATIYNEVGIKAIPLDFPENEMQGCVHMLKDSYHKHSAQEFIRMLSESNAVRERIHEWFR